MRVIQPGSSFSSYGAAPTALITAVCGSLDFLPTDVVAFGVLACHLMLFLVRDTCDGCARRAEQPRSD